jgi:transcriptional regulator of acetoin/glycerol metabolism
VVEQWEREYVEDTVRFAKGNLSLAARSAGITRAHFYRLMKKHGIKRSD